MLPQSSAILSDIELPRMVPVRQLFPHNELVCPEKELRNTLSQASICKSIQPGQSICITCGSRGIANHAAFVREIVSFVRERGAQPFLIPAMGSHGGATARGQLDILKSFGITESTCGCPIYSGMETVKIGKTEQGQDVFIDCYAAKADGIILYNRIKPHTSFHGPYESGLMKMAAIGLGKQKGAEACHINGYDLMGEMIPRFGKVVLEKAHILFGVGIIENAHDLTSKIVVLSPEQIVAKEPELLQDAAGQMAQILLPSPDVLVVDQIGKDISGAGMDPNVIGRFFSKEFFGGLKPRQIVALDLTDNSHGNALGIGFADFITRRIFEKIDWDSMYANALTCLRGNSAYLPLVMDSDKLAISGAIHFSWGIDRKNVRIIRIKSTAELIDIEVSESMLEQVETNEQLQIKGASHEWSFNESWNLW